MSKALNGIEIVVSRNAEALRREISEHSYSVTIEAEYGNNTVSGSVLTLAHHGSNSANPCPCILNVEHLGVVSRNQISIIGCSHFDLDTLGGILAVMGNKIAPDEFWSLAAKIDIRGIHNVDLGDMQPQFDAYYAYSETHRVYVSNCIEYVNDIVDEYACFLNVLFYGDPAIQAELIEDGKKWRENLNDLDQDTFVKQYNKVILRKTSSKFVNNLYRSESIVVAYNEQTRAITVSRRDDSVDINCDAVVKKFFGEKAGGRAEIAGSPRDESYEFFEAERFFDRVSIDFSPEVW